MLGKGGSVSELVYLNGSLVPFNQAVISPLDYGYLYGMALFETMRSYKGRVFRLDQHLQRLALSAEELGIKVDIKELHDAVKSTIQANKLDDARVRLTVSAGEGEMTPDTSTCIKPTVLVIARQYHPYPDGVYERGFRGILSSFRRNSQSLLSRIKSANYLESLFARQEARKAGADEVVCLNERGLVAEASMSNIFLVCGGVLKAPGLDSGILPGITRGTVLELAAQQGIPTSEGDIMLAELFNAEEAFLTGSLIEVMPLTVIDNKTIGTGKPGDITGKLMTAYRKLVATELAL
jgi:branched-chain amino acid aminotransferase